MKSYFDIDKVREVLLKHYECFYHFSVDTNLESIKANGLSPLYEDEQSRYAKRHYEPDNALRYCTKENIAGGKSAAKRYTQYFDYNEFISKPNGSNLIQITIPAQSILTRSYGLDFSHGPLASSVQTEIDENALISPEFFLECIQKYGCISCYETIPASEFLDISFIETIS